MDTTHPDLTELQQFVDGKLDDDASSEIEAHLEGCNECVQLIEANPAADPFVDVIRSITNLPASDGLGAPEACSSASRSPDPEAPTMVHQPEISANAKPSRPEVAETAIQKREDSSARPHPTSEAERFGDYELLDEIARGGMGVVYKARHTKLNRIVAMKMILAGRLAGDQDVKRFHNEAEAAARLQHPNIVAIHDVGVIDEQHYFSMEFIEGGSLADVAFANSMSPKEAAATIKTIAEAIEYAHSQGVLHRDLKPQNVLIDANGQPHVTDFGLAKQLEVDSDLTSTGMILGTPNYMSPEQATAQHNKIGPHTDVYALGAMLFELLTRRPPFRGEKAAAVIFDVIETEPPPPSSLVFGIPRDLETICLKCLAKNPAERYATAAQLAEDLDLFLRSEPINARPLSTIGRVLRWSRHRPFLATVLGAGLTFYSFHLVSMLFIRPDDWSLHWIISGLMVTWLASGAVISRLLESPRWRESAAYAFMAITPILTTIGLNCDRGAASAPIAVLIVMIGIAPLMLPSPRLIAFTTATVMACYMSLIVQAGAFVPANRVSKEQAIAFMTCQFAMGLLVYLSACRVRMVAPELASSQTTQGDGAPR